MIMFQEFSNVSENKMNAKILHKEAGKWKLFAWNFLHSFQAIYFV